ncbi:MAG TPA: cytochrome c oxidase accessory protein CcoG [Gemmatimonadaceae bacterium]|nr:cytochrome c oxidase accessory protein CcoG [Gemmatimonadaceae bacterium]
MTVPLAAGRVLPTLNEDGTRRWIRPKPSHGKLHARRRVVAYALMVVFFLIPHLRIGGKPAILLDLPRRQFTLFGTTFLPTDTLLLMLLLASIIITIFLLTALFGRVWCGWACPQTVYMEFLFRPIERWLEGGRSGSLGLDRERRHFHPRRLLKYAIYLGLALFLAHTFLAYFVGTEQLAVWVRRSPAEHPTSFFVMAFTTGLIFFDFAYFREQTCLVACPYGRLQSVLLDRQSLIVAYDVARGEPRMKGKARPEGAGDCIDCGACVLTCPTGIDIRDGLQMECIHCTQCADACDAVMEKIGKPTGLIRYSSQDSLAGRARHMLRPRVVLYPAALALFVGAFIYTLATKADADVTILRGLGAPYQVQAGDLVSNQIRVKIANRSSSDRAYHIAVAGAEGATVIAPENPLRVPAGETATTSLFVVLPEDAFIAGVRPVTFRVSDGDGFSGEFPYRLVGPEDAERHHHDGRREHERASHREDGR